MSLLNLNRSFRNLRRYREIIGVLLKYSFEDVIDQINLDILLKRVRVRYSKRKKILPSQKSRPERVRLALEELGPTFIKLGQMLSTRYDLIPIAYIDELRKLQDNVKSFSIEQSIEIVEEELKASIHQLFDRFDKQPIAAASIAQVHKARTKNGFEVVIKVRRPDILEIIALDIPILRDLAVLIERHIPESRVFDPTGLVAQFQSWIGEELDFMHEGRNIHRFGKNFETYANAYVPKVFWELTTESVLTIEFIDGIFIDQIERIKKAGMDPAVIARNGTLFVLKQIFEHHFFHGDPHPGNLMVLPGHVIAPLDYGLMGRMDNVLVNEVSDLLLGIIQNDASMIVRTLIHLNRLNTDVDRESLRVSVADFLARYHAVPLHMLKFEHFFNDLVKLIRKNDIKFPQNLYLMGKSMMMMESIAQKLDPQFEIITIAKSYFTKTLISRAEAERFVRTASQMVEDYTDLMVMAPQVVSQILKKARWGKIGINLHHMRIDDMLHEMDRSANRLSFSMIIASLVVGSSLIIQLDKGPRLWDLPVFGVIGFTMAGLLGLWLVFSILRSGKI